MIQKFHLYVYSSKWKEESWRDILNINQTVYLIIGEMTLCVYIIIIFKNSKSGTLLFFSYFYTDSVNFVVQLLSHVQLFVTPWIAARQASLSYTQFQSLLKLMPIKLVMSSNHLILCHSLLLLPSIFPSIRVFSNESVLRVRWPQILELQLQSFQWIFSIEFL